MGPVRSFVTHHFRHFNAAVVIDAAKAWEDHLAKGGKMLLTLAGAMSTAELGLSLAEMIRKGQGSRHLLHRRQPRGGRLQPGRARYYVRIPHYRMLTPEDENELLSTGT
jgi:deoxyhypusine synthase